MDYSIIKDPMLKLGIKCLFQEQEEILPDILKGNDVIAILRTGGGKSLLYQIPYLLGTSDETTIVISPLKSLQRDQLDSLAKRLSTSHKRGRLAWKGRYLLNSDSRQHLTIPRHQLSC